MSPNSLTVVVCSLSKTHNLSSSNLDPLSNTRIKTQPMKLANGMLILAFGIAGSDSQSPTTIEVTPNESPTMTHSTIIHAQNVTTKRYLKVTSKSEKTSNSGKSSRTTSNSAKSSKSENRKSETKKKPPS